MDSNTYYAIYESIYYNSIQKQHIELKHKEYLSNLVILNSCHNHGYNVDKENNCTDCKEQNESKK